MLINLPMCTFHLTLCKQGCGWLLTTPIKFGWSKQSFSAYKYNNWFKHLIITSVMGGRKFRLSTHRKNEERRKRFKKNESAPPTAKIATPHQIVTDESFTVSIPLTSYINGHVFLSDSLCHQLSPQPLLPLWMMVCLSIQANSLLAWFGTCFPCQMFILESEYMPRPLGTFLWVSATARGCSW